MNTGTERSLSIRCLRAEDYGEVVRVWRAAGLKITPDGRDGESAFAEQLAVHSTTFLAACDGERMIGVVLGTHDHRKGWINRLAVVPEWRRTGVATALVRSCEDALVKQGIGIVTALVEPENTASAAVFEGLGYADYPIKYFRKVVRPGA